MVCLIFLCFFWLCVILDVELWNVRMVKNVRMVESGEIESLCSLEDFWSSNRGRGFWCLIL